MSWLENRTAGTIAAAPARPSLAGHIQIARIDHWVKNVFVLPGILVALGTDRAAMRWELIPTIVIGLLATCLVASSNYVINEVLDAPSDLHHPTKRLRPVPSGRVSIPLAYVEWLLLMLAGIGLAVFVSRAFVFTMLALWVMGCLYNVPPIRTKDLPYLDVLSEAINNPLRMLAGWYIVNPPAVTPASLLISYWMVGCYFMAVKRFAELREINQTGSAASYRRSFAHYNEARLLVSLTFYGSTAMLFFGAFIMRYRLELILAFPMVAIVMAMYLALAFKQDSAAAAPEKLYREAALMVPVSLCTVLMVALLFIDLPVMHQIFAPMAPTQSQADVGADALRNPAALVAGKLP